MDTAIAALILALIGFGCAIYAIVVGTRRAIRRPKKRPPLADGLYRMRQIGKDGLDTLFEIEEVSSKQASPNSNTKEEISKKETNNEIKQTISEPGSEKATR